jgi:hypothetical protein
VIARRSFASDDTDPVVMPQGKATGFGISAVLYAPSAGSQT